MKIKSFLSNIRSSVGGCIAVCLMESLCMATTGCTPAQKQTALQIVTEINAKTPEIQGAADTVSAMIEALDPASAALISVGDTAFDALATTLKSLTAAYIANPNSGTLLQIEAAINSLESNVNTATLNAVGIKDSKSQKLAIAALKGLATAVTVAFGLISTLESVAQLEQLRETDTIHLARLRPYLDEEELREAAKADGLDIDKGFAAAERFGF